MPSGSLPSLPTTEAAPGPIFARLRGLPASAARWFNARKPSTDGTTLLFASLAVFALLRSYPSLTPQPSSINAHDQAIYIHSGIELLSGKIPPLAYHPLVSVVYALASLPFRNSPVGFIYTEWLVRAVLYFSLWATTLLVARQFDRYAPGWVIAAIWAVAPLPDRLLSNASQMLFVVLSALALQQLMRFAAKPASRHLLVASLSLGFAMLARDEALWILLLTIPTIIAVDLLAHSQSHSPVGTRRPPGLVSHLLAYATPFFLTILIFQLAIYSHTGTLDTGLAVRSYDALEAGQGLTYPERYPGNPFISGIPDSRRIYGRGEDNGYSVLRAVLKNPGPMIQRIGRNILAMPTSLVQGYGGYLGAMLLILAICGFINLARREHLRLIAILVGFSAFELLYIPFFWLTSYWLFVFPLVFGLVALGASWLVHYSPLWFWALIGALGSTALVAAALAHSWRLGYLAIAVLTFMVVAVLTWWSSARAAIRAGAIAALVLLIANPTYIQAPELIPDVYSDPVTQAATWLRDNAPEEAKIASWGSTMVYLSNRPFLSLEGFLDTPSRMADWLIANQVNYLYADGNLATTFPDLLPVIDTLATAGCLIPVFQDDRATGTLYSLAATCRVQ